MTLIDIPLELLRLVVTEMDYAAGVYKAIRLRLYE